MFVKNNDIVREENPDEIIFLDKYGFVQTDGSSINIDSMTSIDYHEL